MADILKYLNMLLIIAIANVLVVPVKILKKTRNHIKAAKLRDAGPYALA